MNTCLGTRSIGMFGIFWASPSRLDRYEQQHISCLSQAVGQQSLGGSGRRREKLLREDKGTLNCTESKADAEQQLVRLLC
jgi:hypothetical protein